MADPAEERSARPIAGQRTLDLDIMPEAERMALGRSLYGVHRSIFGGVSEADFLKHVMSSSAERNFIRLFLGEGGEVVGYCAVHRFRRQVGGRDHVVIRAEAGLKPEYRGRGSTYWFGMVRAFRYKLRHPFQPLWYLGTLVHMSSYHLFCKYFPVIHPAPGRPVPEDIRTLAVALMDSFDSPAVDPADPFVRKVGWITIETPQEAALVRDSGSPDMRFYMERNPGYTQGHGLLVLVPLNFANLLGALARRGAEALRHRFRRRPPAL